MEYFPRSNEINIKNPNSISEYVSEVLDFSSQYGSDSSISYTAYNLSGKPSKYPDYGDFPQAFAMVMKLTRFPALFIIVTIPENVRDMVEGGAVMVRGLQAPEQSVHH